jgi:CubicO group peptidase (beta-lactamase class C family)
VRLKALLVGSALAAGSVLYAQTSLKPNGLPPTRDQFLATFAAYVDALRTQAGIPGMAGVITDSQGVIWQQAFGYQDLASTFPTRTDTPFHFDGLTQVLTATAVLQCVDHGRAVLDTHVGSYTPSFAEPNATIAQILSHTSGAPGSLSFSYNIARLDALRYVLQTCDATTFRWAFRDELQFNVMMDSMPGPDAASPALSPLEGASDGEAVRYQSILGRLATPYSVNASNVATPSRYPAVTLGAGSGLVSTVLDFAKFDVALKQGLLLHPDTLAAAWSNPVNSNGQVLPHGYGWFVQSYNGEPVVWQFGAGANASSSLLITLPARGLTLILVANSDGLAKPASLSAGDVTVSPFAKVFLGLVVK